MKKFALTACALALMATTFGTASVWAQTSTPAATGKPPATEQMRHRSHHERIDKDGDKVITRDEAKGHPKLEKNFDAIDTNKDGKLSPEERKAFRAAHKGEHMKKLDTNGDKMITRDEAKGHTKLEKNFDAIDANKDGKLSPEELKAFHAARHSTPHATK